MSKHFEVTFVERTEKVYTLTLPALDRDHAEDQASKLPLSSWHASGVHEEKFIEQVKEVAIPS